MSSSGITNFYDILPKEYKPSKIQYKNQDEVAISVPMRCLLIGSSGVGKTNYLLNLMKKISAFSKIYLFVKDPEEPLYKWMIDHYTKIENQIFKKTNKIHKIIYYSNDPSEIPGYDHFEKKDSTLVIFDDLVNEKSKNLDRCANLFTMGRKHNVSCVFISQSFFKVPLIIRQNSDYCFILRVNTVRDLHRILGEYQLGATKEQIEDMYRKATGKRGDALLIDVAGPDHLRYRHNFKPFVLPTVNEEEDEDD